MVHAFSLPPVTAGGLGMILGDLAQDENWTNWQWDKLVSAFSCLLIPRILLSRLRVQVVLTGTNGRKLGTSKKKKIPLFGNRKTSGKKILSFVFFYGASTLSTLFSVR
jgi:hypothetical protein